MAYSELTSLALDEAGEAIEAGHVYKELIDTLWRTSSSWWSTSETIQQVHANCLQADPGAEAVLDADAYGMTQLLQDLQEGTGSSTDDMGLVIAFERLLEKIYYPDDPYGVGYEGTVTYTDVKPIQDGGYDLRDYKSGWWMGYSPEAELWKFAWFPDGTADNKPDAENAEWLPKMKESDLPRFTSVTDNGDDWWYGLDTHENIWKYHRIIDGFRQDEELWYTEEEYEQEKLDDALHLNLSPPPPAVDVAEEKRPVKASGWTAARPGGGEGSNPRDRKNLMGARGVNWGETIEGTTEARPTRTTVAERRAEKEKAKVEWGDLVEEWLPVFDSANREALVGGRGTEITFDFKNPFLFLGRPSRELNRAQAKIILAYGPRLFKDCTLEIVGPGRVKIHSFNGKREYLEESLRKIGVTSVEFAKRQAFPRDEIGALTYQLSKATQEKWDRQSFGKLQNILAGKSRTLPFVLNGKGFLILGPETDREEIDRSVELTAFYEIGGLQTGKARFKPRAKKGRGRDIYDVTVMEFTGNNEADVEKFLNRIISLFPKARAYYKFED